MSDTTITITPTADTTVTAPPPQEHWFYAFWRPAVAWQYVFVCLFDFVVAPVLLTLYSLKTGEAYVQWHPITLEGGGLYHMSMGAIVGVTSWSRGFEKLKDKDKD